MQVRIGLMIAPVKLVFALLVAAMAHEDDVDSNLMQLAAVGQTQLVTNKSSVTCYFTIDNYVYGVYLGSIALSTSGNWAVWEATKTV
eukprot:2200623-Pyramimonas_sp.AAC.1